MPFFFWKNYETFAAAVTIQRDGFYKDLLSLPHGPRTYPELAAYLTDKLDLPYLPEPHESVRWDDSEICHNELTALVKLVYMSNCTHPPKKRRHVSIGYDAFDILCGVCGKLQYVKDYS